MAWFLTSSRTDILIQRRKVVGRADLKSEPQLSRQHFEIYLDHGHMFARDLGSTNGTVVDGQKMNPHSPVEVTAGSVFLIGATKFTLRQQNPNLSLIADGAIFAFLLVLVLLEPSLGYGRAIGITNFVLLIGSLLTGVMLSSMLWKLVLRRAYWSKVTYGIYATAVALSALMLNQFTVIYADRNFALGEETVEAKIRFFCLTHFDQPECVRQVNLCPACTLRIDRWERTQISAKLKTFRAQYAKPEAVRAPTSKLPN